MPYILTAEQQDIITTATSLPVGSILKISAVAGASKTYTLLKVAEALPHTSQLYLAYNKAIATESKSKFPSYVNCMTTHALAYTPIVKYGLSLDGVQGQNRNIGYFTHRDIQENFYYEDKLLVIKHLEGFFLSSYTDIDSYIMDRKAPFVIKEYFLKMVNNEILCTHAFYLKMYHILLTEGHIHYDKPFDVIMLDEAGDINEVTLGIFLALPANLKIMVGDPLQNIYSFNHTINGFTALKDVGITKTLSQSFRCSKAIAERIEGFCKHHLDENTIFEGTDHADTTIHTEAIISRTNAGLLSYMLTLAEAGIPFNLTREAKHIFAVLLALMNLKKGCKVYEPSLKFLQKSIDYYFNSTAAQFSYGTCLKYIQASHASEEPEIKSAIQTIYKHGTPKIYTAYKYAKQCETSKKPYPLTLTTGHSSKGLTFDKVTIAQDFDFIGDLLGIPSKERSQEEEEELRLYYVVASRAKLKLVNARYLDK